MGKKPSWSWLGVDTPFDPKHTLVTSHILSPNGLAFFRQTGAFYTFVSLIFSIIWRGVVIDDLEKYFTYFTQLSFIGLCAYFFASSVQTVAYIRQVRRKGTVETISYPLQKWHKFLQFLHLVLFSTIVTFPIVVTIVYWVLLASAESFETPYQSWSNVTFHILNTIFALLEVLLTRAHPVWRTLPIVMILALLYPAMAYVVHADQGYYTYSFLDPKKQGAKVAAYIIGIAVGEVVVFAAIRGLCALRDLALRKKETEQDRNEKLLHAAEP